MYFNNRSSIRNREREREREWEKRTQNIYLCFDYSSTAARNGTIAGRAIFVVHPLFVRENVSINYKVSGVRTINVPTKR